MVSLIELPAEILVQICECIRAKLPHDYQNLLLTCRRLRDAGEEILYRDVCLKSRLNDSSSISLIFSRTRKSQRDYIQSMRVVFQKSTLSSFHIGMPSASSYLTPFFTTLPTLPRLTTFSLHQPYSDSRNLLLPASIICYILDTLPQTVVNLELDTAALEYVFEWARLPTNPYHTHEHVCRSIKRLIPRLKTLRLSLAYLCPEFLRLGTPGSRSPVSKLRTAVVRLDHRTPEDHRSQEATYDCGVAGSGRDNNPHVSSSQLAKSLKQYINAEAFPDLTQFLVIAKSARRFTTGKSNRHGGFAIHNLVANRTLIFPVIRLELQPEHLTMTRGWTFLPAFEAGTDSSLTPPDQIEEVCDKYLIRGFDGLECFGTYRDIAACMENDIEWREFPMGARLPNEASQGNTDEFGPDLSRLSKRDEANLPPRTMTALWKREADVGAVMLKAEVVDGLQHDKILSEVPPPGWRWKAYTNRRGEREVERVPGENILQSAGALGGSAFGGLRDLG